MPALPRSILDAALNQEDRRADARMADDLEQQRQQVFQGFSMPTLDDLLGGIGLGQQAQPASAQQQPAPRRQFELPDLDALLGDLAPTPQTMIPGPDLSPESGLPILTGYEGTDPSRWTPLPVPQSSGAAPAQIDNSSRQAFVRSAWPHMLEAAGGNQDAAEMMLAAAISENGSIGSGRPFWANNFFGIKGKGDAGSVTADTHEIVNGQRVDMPDAFAAYSSPTAGFRAFFDFLQNNPRYAGALQRYQQTGDASQLFRDVNAAGYATDPEWASKVENIRRNQVAPLTRGVAMNAGGAPPPAAPSQPSAGATSPPAEGAGMWSPDEPSGPAAPAYQMGAGRNAGGVMMRGPLSQQPELPPGEDGPITQPMAGYSQRYDRPRDEVPPWPVDAINAGFDEAGRALRSAVQSPTKDGVPIEPVPDDWQLPPTQEPPIRIQRNIVPYDSETGQTGDPASAVQYRQPLAQQPELPPAEPYDPRDADSGPREAIPYGPGLEGGRPVEEPASQSPRQTVAGSGFGLKPVWDAAGQVIGYVQDVMGGGSAPLAGGDASASIAPPEPDMPPPGDPYAPGQRESMTPPPAHQMPANPDPWSLGAIGDAWGAATGPGGILEPMGGGPRIIKRIREIDAQAVDAGYYRGARDPDWQAKNPELAAEYEELRGQFAMTVAGQVGDSLPRRARQTVEVLQEAQEAAWQRAQAARQAGDDASDRAAMDEVARIQSDLIDAQNARRELEPQIRSEVGRPIQTLPTDPRSADDAMRAQFPDERVRAAPDDLSGPVSIPASTVGRRNALVPFDPASAAAGSGAGLTNEDEDFDPLRAGAGALAAGMVGRRARGAAGRTIGRGGAPVGPKQSWQMTRDEYVNYHFEGPQSGSWTPKEAAEARAAGLQGQYQTLHDVANLDDPWQIGEVLGRGYEDSFGPASMHVAGRAKRDAPITVYRTSDIDDDILPGSFVTESKRYALEHAEANIHGGSKPKLSQKVVRPSELVSYGDPHEFIWVPQSIEREHERAVLHAAFDGKDVPVEILAGYPNIIRAILEPAEGLKPSRAAVRRAQQAQKMAEGQVPRGEPPAAVRGMVPFDPASAALGSGAGLTGEEGEEVDPLRAGAGALAAGMAGRRLRGAGAPKPGARNFANAADALAAARQAIGRPNPAAPTAGLTKMEALRRWIVRNTTDNRVDLAELQKEAQRLLGRDLEADEMVLELTRANPSGAAKVMIDDAVRPALQAVGEDRDTLSVLMRLVNNADVATATGNPDRLFSGGLTGEDSRAAAAHLWSTLTPEQQQALGQSSDALYRVVDHYRQEMVRAGAWTPDLAADLAQKYPHWVPTKILDYMNDPATVQTGTRSISLRDRGLRAYTIDGTAKAAEDPIASLVRYIQDSEAIIQKNEAFNAFVNLRDRVPGWDALMREVPSNTTPSRARGEKAVTGFVNGERKTFMVPAPMAAAIQMEAGQSVPVFRELTQLFKEFITRTPLFVAGQIPLDAFGYTVRETAREGGILATPKVAAELARGYAEAFRGLLDGSFKGDAARYLKEGGGMAGFYERAADAASQTVDDLTKRSMLEIKSADDARKLVGWLLTGGWVQAVGARVEMAPRVASFRLGEQRALKAGASAEKAALEGMIGARDVTLDFQRGGTAAKIANQIIPFFNVGVQSSVTLPRMFRENPVGATTTLLSLVAAPTMAAEAWNRADAQRSKDYDDVPDYVKDRGIVIMLPGVTGRDERGDRRPNYALIPMRELAPVAILSRELMRGVLGTSDRSPVETAQAILGAASPIQASSGADLFSSLNPVGANTGLQLYADRDFFRGGSIATDRRDEEASSLATGLANVTGVGRPSQWEFGIRDLFGGTGAMAAAASNLATGKAKDEDRIQNTPGAGGLISRFVGDAVGGNLNRAQDTMRTPEIKRVLRDAGLRDDQLAPLDMKGPNDFQFTRQEQAQAQRLMNQYLTEANGLATLPQSIPNWSTLSQQAKQNVIRDAVAAARKRAEGEVLSGIPEADRQRRFEQAAKKKAG